MARMADSVTPADLPAGMDAYMGYVDGRWPDFAAIAAREQVPVYGLTVFGNPALGQGTDSEPGDASIAQTVTATKGELARGVDRPIVYCPESWAEQMVTAHTAGGILRASYRLLTAHYALKNGQPWAHICGPATCGCPVEADGTQWVDHGPWDESLLDDTFIIAASHPGPAPTPTEEPVTDADYEAIASKVVLALRGDTTPGHILFDNIDEAAQQAIDGRLPAITAALVPAIEDGLIAKLAAAGYITGPPPAATGTPAATA